MSGTMVALLALYRNGMGRMNLCSALMTQVPTVTDQFGLCRHFSYAAACFSCLIPNPQAILKHDKAVYHLL